MAIPTMLESARTHTAVGAFGNIGGAITGATNVSPIVVTTTSAHGLVTGDQVQVTGVVGNTAANGTFLVTALTPTTFSEQGSTGNGAYASGGAISQASDISGVLADWTLKLRVESLTAGKKIQIALQDSVDGFVNDIVTRATVNVQGQIMSSPTFAAKDFEWRKYDVPSTRFGTASARLRLSVLAVDAAATAVVSAWYES